MVNINAPQAPRRSFYSNRSGPTVNVKANLCCLSHVNMGSNDSRKIFVKIGGIKKIVNKVYFAQMIEKNFGVVILWPEERETFELSELSRTYVELLGKQDFSIEKIYENYVKLICFLAKQFSGVVNPRKSLIVFRQIIEEGKVNGLTRQAEA